MSDNSRRPIVIRRKKHGKHKPHGMWKIAYADFMTAMMAFFLVMWLLAGFSEGQIAQINQYFRTPLAVALAGGDKNSASNSVIPGGGDDPMHSEGEKALTVPEATTYNPKPGQQDIRDDASLREFKQYLEAQISLNPTLKKAESQLKIDIVSRGLRLQIIDTRDQPMFELGEAEIEPFMVKVLNELAPMLDTLPNSIMLIGHTDDLPFATGGSAYSNWELSTERANASRRALVAGGMAPNKVLRVVGAAATMRLPGSEPGAPANRRISILVLNRETKQKILDRGKYPIQPLNTALIRSVN